MTGGGLGVLTLLLAALLGVLLLWALAQALGRWRWAALGQELEARLAPGATPAPSAVDLHRELAGLPAPVARYLGLVLTDGQAMVARVRLRQSGQFNGSDGEPDWQPFTATQRVVTQVHGGRPGFDWDARIAGWLGLSVWVRDAYAGGAGLLQATLLGLIPLATQRDTPAAAQGELMRYLAETPWYPTALLPSQGVRWEALDARSAWATLTDGDTTVRLRFGFGPDGLVESVHAPARPRRLRGVMGVAPWRCRLSGYVRRQGMRLPFSAEVAWQLPTAGEPYWRGRVTQIDFSFAPLPLPLPLPSPQASPAALTQLA